jgi:hypothetical protein
MSEVRAAKVSICVGLGDAKSREYKRRKTEAEKVATRQHTTESSVRSHFCCATTHFIPMQIRFPFRLLGPLRVHFEATLKSHRTDANGSPLRSGAISNFCDGVSPLDSWQLLVIAVSVSCFTKRRVWPIKHNGPREAVAGHIRAAKLLNRQRRRRDGANLSTESGHDPQLRQDVYGS